MDYLKNKIYALLAFFFAFELFITGSSERSGSPAQYIMLIAALALVLAGLFFFRKKTAK